MEQNYIIQAVNRLLKYEKLSLNNEKVLQVELQSLLIPGFGDHLEREKYLDKKNIIDFFIQGVGIEVKVGGVKRSVYKQCQRYCAFDEIKALILITNLSMGFPKEMNGKDCFVIKLGVAWL